MSRMGPETRVRNAEATRRRISWGYAERVHTARGREEAVLPDVEPRLRGQGIGSAILKELTSISRGRGVDLIEINVDEGDVDAQRFYERHGFAVTESGSTERASTTPRNWRPGAEAPDPRTVSSTRR